MHRWLPIMRIQICEAYHGLGAALNWEENQNLLVVGIGAIAIDHFLKSFKKSIKSLNTITESI